MNLAGENALACIEYRWAPVESHFRHSADPNSTNKAGLYGKGFSFANGQGNECVSRAMKCAAF